jgi:hypothetical protein
MNHTQSEQLFTDLTPAQAAVVTGGEALACPYTTTEAVKRPLNIRSSPTLTVGDKNLAGSWRRGQKFYLESPAIMKNGFRKFSKSDSRWVFAEFIKPVPGGKCLRT